MPRSSRFALATLVALVLAASALPTAPAGANELWVVPGKHTAHAEVGDWATTPSAMTHFSFAVPGDFESLVAAKVIVIGQQTRGASYDLGLSLSNHMMPHNLVTASLPGQPLALVAGDLLEIDVTAIFPPLQAGIDYVSLSFATNPPGHARVVGLRVQYRAVNPLANQTCAQGEFLSGFDADGNPVCTSRTQLLAGIACPAGTFLVGFDAAGPVCKTLAEVTGGGGPPPPPGENSALTINNVSLPEGNAGSQTNFVFTVTLARAPGTLGDTVTVDFTTQDGTATVADNDYVANAGTLTFLPGDPDTQPITVVVNGDDVQEPIETFVVKLSNPSNAVIATDTGTGTINNDDNGGGGR